MTGPEVAPWQVWWVDVNPRTHTDRGLPWQPAVALDGDLGYAMCDQIKAIDKQRLEKPHAAGFITSAQERENIARALRELVTIDV